MSYITKSPCKLCSNKLTYDCLRYEVDLCYRCVSKIHSAYELRHSGQSSIDYARKKISKKLRDYIHERDAVCLKCGSDSDLTVDHIVPVTCGGNNEHDNLKLLCRKCNSRKNGREEDCRQVIE